MALTAVPAKMATSSPQTPATLSSGRPLRTSRRIRYAATTTSSVFPIVCPIAEPTGSVWYWFASRSPRTTPGHSFRPPR